MIKTNTMRSV